MIVFSIQQSGQSLVFQMGKLRHKDIWPALGFTGAGGQLGAHVLFTALCRVNLVGFSLQRDMAY